MQIAKKSTDLPMMVSTCITRSTPSSAKPITSAKSTSAAVSEKSAPAIITSAMRVSSSFRSSRIRDFAASDVPAQVIPTNMPPIAACHPSIPGWPRRISQVAVNPVTSGMMNPPTAASIPAFDDRISSAGSISAPTYSIITKIPTSAKYFSPS